MTADASRVMTRGFHFAKVSSLRAGQLTRGCAPRVPPGHTVASTARREVAAGTVAAIPRTGEAAG